MSTPNELSLKHLLQDSVLMNLSMGTFILGTMAYEPEIWLHDYPPDIQEKYGPQSERSKKLAAVTAVPFFIGMFGGMIGSNLRLKRRNGGKLSLKAAFLNAYALILSGWLFDLTILDWFMFVHHTPDFVVLPGTEGMAGYDDYMFHLKAHVGALPMLAAFSFVIALMTAARPWRK